MQDPREIHGGASIDQVPEYLELGGRRVRVRQVLERFAIFEPDICAEAWLVELANGQRWIMRRGMTHAGWTGAPWAG